MATRKLLLKEEILSEINLDEYSHKAYEATIKETPTFSGDSPQEARRRELMYLNLRWFMATLLERMDRTSMHHGLEARVPFADIRIVEYLYNVPWEFKFMDGMEKGLLRYAARKWLPDSVLFRKKSPYPKTYDPKYLEENLALLDGLLEKKDAPIFTLVAREQLENIRNNEPVWPWYGQLMRLPQTVAYMLQVNLWLETNHITFV